MNRLNEITFNFSLIREISSILLLKKLIDEEHVDRVRYTGMHLHHINGDAEWKFLEHLYQVGYGAADRWLTANSTGWATNQRLSSIYFAEMSKATRG